MFFLCVSIAVLLGLYDHYIHLPSHEDPESTLAAARPIPAESIDEHRGNATDTPQIEIAYVNAIEIPEIVEKLPYRSWHKSAFQKEGGLWRFLFDCNHTGGSITAAGLGHTPREAFALAKHTVLRQLSDWHKNRFDEGSSSQAPPSPAYGLKALIVDDDVDLALSMQSALSQMGFRTEVAFGYEDLHRKIVSCDADFIFLDWKLNGGVNAGQVVEKAIRLIETFGDLREKFNLQRPRIVTYSALERAEIALPAAGSRYFTHFDHWQKPLQFHEVVERASNLLTTAA
jgi:hypothetical protein